MSNNKRESILRSAFELFAANGFSNTKMIDIAENAGIGKGTIYQYFSSKDVLFIEFIKENLLKFYLEIDSIFSEESLASKKLEKFIRYESEHISSSGKILNYKSINEYHSFKNTHIHDIFFEAQFLRFNIVKKIIDEGISNGEFKKIDSDAAAIIVIGSLTSFLICKHNLYPNENKISFGKDFRIEELLEQLFTGLKK